MSQQRKVQVFHAVVSEAFLSELEVRTLSNTDMQRLESARGLLLRRIFGRNGFGAVQGEDGHRPVPISLLQRLDHTVPYGFNGFVLRASLAAGAVLLDLAAFLAKWNVKMTHPWMPMAS